MNLIKAIRVEEEETEGATGGMLMSDAMLNAMHSSSKAMGTFCIGSTCAAHTHTTQTSSNRSHEKT